LLRVAVRHRRSAPSAVVAGAHDPIASPLDRLGRHLWRRPPPLLLGV
jgi:hypothetical protein